MMSNPNPAPVIHPLPSDVFSAMHVLDLSIIQYLLNIYRYMASTYASINFRLPHIATGS